LCATAVAAFSGCGSSLDTGAPVKASAACVQIKTANAKLGARCNGGTLADWQAFEANIDDCAAYDRHVAEGKVEYRRDKFAACIAEFDQPCDTPVTDNCLYAVLHGLVPDGQHCQDTEVCGTVSACFLVDGRTCGEVCVRAANEGEQCGLYCGGTTPCLDISFCHFGLACVNGICVTAKQLGDACGGADPVPCVSPLFCTADPAVPQSTGTCAGRMSRGACRSDIECPGTEFCFQGRCAVRRALGAACGDATTGCAFWTACDSSGICAPAGQPGLACAPVPGQPYFGYCTSGSCGVDLTCAAYATAGGICTTATCAQGTSCDSASSTCVACGP